jgi:D-sedoheptulose 7-phosphate isomerase
MSQDDIRQTIEASIRTKQQLLESGVADIHALCEQAIQALSGGGKLMFCGNGGSSCDAAHAAGELVGWFEHKDRPGFAAIALGHEVPTLTAIGNDAGFEHVFARQVEALGRRGDLLVGITTALLCGGKRGAALELADVAVCVPSENTARIQECHLMVVHMLCAAVERVFAADQPR